MRLKAEAILDFGADGAQQQNKIVREYRDEYKAIGDTLSHPERANRCTAQTGVLATPRLHADVEVALTKREAEVLRAVANGQTNVQVAESLGISYETVKVHMQHVLRTVGVETRAQAAIWAERRNIA